MVYAIEHDVAETIVLSRSIETPRTLPFLDHVSPGSRNVPASSGRAPSDHCADRRHRRSGVLADLVVLGPPGVNDSGRDARCPRLARPAPASAPAAPR